MQNAANVIGAALFSLPMLYFVIWIVVIVPARMARVRGRYSRQWVLISIVGSPILAMLLLNALGNDPTKR